MQHRHTHNLFAHIYIIRLKIFISIIITMQVFVAGSAYTQTLNLKFKHINIGQGLSNSTIETIYQDNKGFIWFGTRDGLNKYDGYQFKVFKNQPGRSNSISDNFI